MIFVTVGTNEARFDRLLRAVAELDVDEEVIVQHGHSSPVGPRRAQLVDFLPFDDMVATIRRARIVITHAGVGSIMVALANERRPIVLPRLAANGEAVDDHQLQLGRRFAAVGLVTLVETQAALREALMEPVGTVALVPSSSELGADLGRFVGETIGAALLPARA
jgi:beta-1,4-N-acetylglucosaminyltransferase